MYEITRLEATHLVDLYMKSTNGSLSQKSRKCKYTSPIKTFRNMTKLGHMGAVLVGKGPSHDKHAETSDMFFNAIKELVDMVGKKDFTVHATKSRIPIQHISMLGYAIDNYLQQTHEHIKEAISDNTYEYNDCSVCKWSGTDYFYYSTIYGLNEPVCSFCVEEKEKEEFNQEEEDDVRYRSLINPETCFNCKYKGGGYFYYGSNNSNPVCVTCEDKRRINEDDVSECSHSCYDDEDEDDDDEYVPSDEEEVSDDEEASEDEDEDEDEEDFCDDPHCQENDDEPEKFFGCEGCQYEWRDGWQKGWKAAMKQIKKFAKKQKRPENIQIPECAYCGASHNLKKCAGTCEGAVRYCSNACQKTDWNEGHKKECCAKQ